MFITPSEEDIPSDRLLELRAVFLAELAQGYETSRDALTRLGTEPHDDPALHTVLDFFHRIAGTAVSVGLPVLGQLAAVCEEMGDLMTGGQIIDGASVVPLLQRGLEGVAEVLGNTRNLPKDQDDLTALFVPDGVSDARAASKILIVDDDPFSARLIDDTLRNAGFRSFFCTDSQKAMGVIDEELPDMVILDVMMPGLNGFELCRRIREHPGMVFAPILFVTKKGDLEARVKGLEVGGNDYIPKPFEPRELIARVRSHMERLATLREMAIRDGLTRCFNNKYFRTRLEQEVARARRYDQQLCLCLLDIDHFKRVNDDHGHAAGDFVLSHLSSIVRASVRSTDLVARYGGEEFAILFIEAALREAELVSERLRERVASHRFRVRDDDGDGEEVRVTVSLGIAQLRAEDTVAHLFDRADAALYGAKDTGRNRICVA